MFREHGRPDLLREDAAIAELGARISSRRRAALAFVLVAASAGASASCASLVEMDTGRLGPGITGRAIGFLVAIAFISTATVGHAISTRVVLLWSVRAARALASERRCDEEPLVDAARLFSGGSPT